MTDTQFCSEFNLKAPIIMAPMFLVSNLEMMEAGMDAGILSVFPTLNYRKEKELDTILEQLNKKLLEVDKGSYGVNLIVQKSNPLYEKHLKTCIDHKVPFLITSLGNPRTVIDAAHSYGAKVYCDVVNLQHAKKCFDEGCDGFIAVGQGAGGHAGNNPLHILIPALRRDFPTIPVIAAGGIAEKLSIKSMLVLGAAGVSIGTRFISSTEAGVADAYKNSIVDSGMDDIVLTEKISGTPCNVINTPFAKKIGYRQNWFEKLLNTNKTTKKYFKMLTQYRGMKALEKAVHPGSYQNLWSAGKSVEMIHDIKPIAQIVKDLI